MRVVLAINYVNYPKGIKRNLQDTAVSVISANKPSNVSLISLNYLDELPRSPCALMVFQQLVRDSKKELGNSRRLPYIKEILDICSKIPCDVFGYMNSDILLKNGFFKVFKGSYDAYVFYKRDIEPLSASNFLKNEIKVVDNAPAGVDCVFFNRSWWGNNRRFFPDDLVLGETEWDTCYNSIIQKVCKKYYLGRDLYHVVHDRIWDLGSRGAVNNTLIWQRVRELYGLPQFNPENKHD